MTNRPKNNNTGWSVLFLTIFLFGCADSKDHSITTYTITPSFAPPPTSTSTITTAPSPTAAPTATPRITRSIDLVAFQSSRNGAWFSVKLDTLPETPQTASVTFDIQTSVVQNRREGQIAPTLVSGYVFLQWGDISPSMLDKQAHTIDALFIRSAGMSFVDYPNNRVLWWDEKSTDIPMDVRGMIDVCNKRQIPVFLEINYSDYAAGPIGTGVESLQPADNIAGTITYINMLKAQGLHVAGVTFGDEVDDPATYGGKIPNIHNSDLVGRFITYARALKSEFPELKVYAFDSNIMSERGMISTFWPFLQTIRQAEIKDGIDLLDGFTFHQSFPYIDDSGRLLDSQLILDDTESLYRNTPVYRFDVDGTSNPNPDRDYLHTLINKTHEIFGRSIDIGLTEYLPAGPTQISEIDTSRYSDIDFIIHYSDVVGIYAELGLDVVSKIMFGDSVDMHKAYFDREGNLGINYPIHEQLARYFAGEMLNVGRSVEFEKLKVKVYAAKKDGRYFVMILNKDVGQEASVQINVPGQLSLTVRLPRHSYTSLIINEGSITISGIGD